MRKTKRPDKTRGVAKKRVRWCPNTIFLERSVPYNQPVAMRHIASINEEEQDAPQDTENDDDDQTWFIRLAGAGATCTVKKEEQLDERIGRLQV